MSKYSDGPVAPRIGAYLETKYLAHAQPVLTFQKFALVRPIPANKGQTIKMRRALPFALATTAITEGVRPSAQSLAYQDVSFTLQQYGAWTSFTDQIQDTHEDPVLNDLAVLSGEQGAETVEKVLIGNIIGGTTYIFSNGVSRGSVNTKVTLNTQRKATRLLKNARAKKITKILSGSVNIGTKPVEASFVAIAHTDLEADIRGISGFKAVAEYGSMQPLCPEEIGCVEDVRYILSQNLTPWTGGSAGGTPGGLVVTTNSTNADVYPILYFGEEAYGCTPLKGQNAVDLKIMKPGEARYGDELGQWGSFGWKTYHASGILNQNWIVRAEVAATLL